MKKLSVILPSFNEEKNIERAATVLPEILSTLDADYELVFVDDGSRDATYEEICKAAEKNSRIKGVSFSRNFGKEAAIFAGLEAAGGDCVVVMDVDLQHPPTTIPKMYECWKNGAEVVEGVKSSRGKETILHKMSAGLFYKIMTMLTGMDMKASSDFKLLDRKVVNVLLSLSERNTFFRALSFWVGFKTEKVEYEVADREFGESKWSTRSLIKYAISNATSFSILPLRIVTLVGGILVFAGILLAIQTLVRFFLGNSQEGFTTVILLILIVGGFIMISMGVLGNYIGRIFEEVKGRPRYIVSRKVGGEENDSI